MTLKRSLKGGQRKFVIDEVKGFGDTAVYNVRREGQKEWEGTQVWCSSGTPRCTSCSGPLRAMLSNCAHARAVKRWLAIYK